MTDLSVVIPTYNRRAILAQTIDRLCRQTVSRERYEVLVIDDCSTDETRAFLEGRAFPIHIRYMRNPENLGAARARNIGVRAASGHLVLMIDDDILADEGLVEAHLDKHRSMNKDIVVVGAVPPQPEHESIWNEYLSRRYERIMGRLAEARDDLPYGLLLTGNVSLEKSAFLAVGMFDERYTYSLEDTELGLRLKRAG